MQRESSVMSVFEFVYLFDVMRKKKSNFLLKNARFWF